MKDALGLTLGALLDIPFDSRSPMQREAIAAAREALAQPDYRAVKTYHEGKPVYVSQPEQEPIGLKKLLGDIQVSLLHGDVDCRVAAANVLGVLITNFQEQPKQKPVATMKMLHTYGDTTPPKRPWVGLTEQDFSAINQSCLTKLQAATSAESILKEKNA